MPLTEDALINELARLERANDLPSAFRLLVAQPLPPNSLATIAISLYRRDLSALAFLIVQKLLEAGVENWMLHAIAAHLAIRLGQDDMARHCIPRLAQLLATAGDAQHAAARQLLDPFLQRDVIMAFHTGNHALTSAYTQVWGAIEPATLTRLAPPPTERVPDLTRFYQPDDGAKLLYPAAPTANLPRAQRRAVLGIRHRWSPEQPDSREHDIPARYVLALESYGWRTNRQDLRSLADAKIVAEDFEAIAALCRETDADLLILDDFQPQRGNHAAGRIIAALRQERPTLKIVSLYFDPWQPECWNDIEDGAGLLDGIWSLVVTPVWQRPAFAGKTLFLPFPHGGAYPAPLSLKPSFRFGGGVQYTNWDRALWAAAITQAGLPQRIEASQHQEDNRDPLESYRAYMLRAQTGEANLNFARRSNGTRTLTGRTFETLATGGLLVQERSDDIDLFFTAGRHYLRFETLTDLFDIAALLQQDPERAEAIRREGAAFFAERYSDEKLIAYLDQFLFHRESAARAAA
ncbi:MAG TPA: glycosyltransferase [Stellaceae bacterium]|nr:glycosyltransferase [Stellaceae bacterium]